MTKTKKKIGILVLSPPWRHWLYPFLSPNKFWMFSEAAALPCMVRWARDKAGIRESHPPTVLSLLEQEQERDSHHMMMTCHTAFNHLEATGMRRRNQRVKYLTDGIWVKPGSFYQGRMMQTTCLTSFSKGNSWNRLLPKRPKVFFCACARRQSTCVLTMNL